MPVEALIAVDMPNPFRACPKCGKEFSPFLRGQVARFDWFGLRKRIWAVICWRCKEIVDYEPIPRPTPGKP